MYIADAMKQIYHKSIVVLCNTQYFYIVVSDILLNNNNTHTECIAEVQLQYCYTKLPQCYVTRTYVRCLSYFLPLLM